MSEEQSTTKLKSLDEFCEQTLSLLSGQDVPFLVGGAYALQHFTGVFRETKDLDLFCRASDYPKLLRVLEENGYDVDIPDSRWIARSAKDGYFADIIFNSVNGSTPISDSWFVDAPEIVICGVPVSCLKSEDLLFLNLYIQDRIRYDGADVNHLILKQGLTMDWSLILERLEQHWILLLSQLLNFYFVYPSEREKIPAWVVDELLNRLKEIRALPVPKDAVCLGPLLSQTQYETDIKEWGYKIVTMAE